MPEKISDDVLFKNNVNSWLSSQLGTDSLKSRLKKSRGCVQFCKSDSIQQAFNHLMKHIRENASEVKDSAKLFDLNAEKVEKLEKLKVLKSKIKHEEAIAAKLREQKVQFQRSNIQKSQLVTLKLDQRFHDKLKATTLEVKCQNTDKKCELLKPVKKYCRFCNTDFQEKQKIKDTFANSEYLDCLRQTKELNENICLLHDAKSINKEDIVSLKKQVLSVFNNYPASYLSKAVFELSKTRNTSVKTDNSSTLTKDAFEILFEKWLKKCENHKQEYERINEYIRHSNNETKIIENMLKSLKESLKNMSNSDTSVEYIIKQDHIDKLLENVGLNAHLLELKNGIFQIETMINSNIKSESSYEYLISEVKQVEKMIEEDRFAIAKTTKENSILKKKLADKTYIKYVEDTLVDIKQALSNISLLNDKHSVLASNFLKHLQEKNLSQLLKYDKLPIQSLCMRSAHNNKQYHQLMTKLDLPCTSFQSSVHINLANRFLDHHESDTYVTLIDNKIQTNQPKLKNLKKLCSKWNAEQKRQVTKVGPKITYLNNLQKKGKQFEKQLIEESNEWNCQSARLCIDSEKFITKLITIEN